METSWHSSWAPDPDVGADLEGGDPPQSLEQRLAAIDREGRYIDHIALQGLATLKKAVIVVWRKEKAAGWRRIAVMRPGASGKRPIVLVVLCG